MSDDIFVVEKILDKRRSESGENEFLIKWFGYDEQDASWEPEENVFCKDLILIFERSEDFVRKVSSSILEEILDEIEKKQSLVQEQSTESPKSDDRRTNLLDENGNDLQTTTNIDFGALQPEKIVSITRSRSPSEKLEFLLKCSLCPKKLFFISNEQAKELFPQLLIDFYERNIHWFIDQPVSTRRKSRRDIS